LVSQQRFGRAYLECAEKLRALYRAHIRSEDEMLTALAKREFDQAEFRAISSEMRERRARTVTALPGS
jgi:hypothetical protein